MNGEYSKLKDFWNEAFKGQEVYVADGKWVTDEVFNQVINDNIPKGGTVLDYGSGSGWALPEIAFTQEIGEGIGMDTSEEGVRYSNQVAEASGLTMLHYFAGDESLLNDYREYFDFILSVNVVDVLPDEIIYKILEKLAFSLKNGGTCAICINPELPAELLSRAGYLLKDGFLYKDGILRGNQKTKEEWITLFQKFFTFAEYKEFALTEREKTYKRRMFLLKK